MPPAPDRMVWIDLEMTGLDPDACFIMEIASLVTDSELQVLAEGPNLVIHLDDAQLATLSEWSRDFFGRNGLIERCRRSAVPLEHAEDATLRFLAQHAVAGTAPLCGNSVHHDRLFLRRHMPRLLQHLHYRIVDVSSIKEVVGRWYPGQLRPPPKAEKHEALLDIRESVEELRYYRARFFVPPPSPGGL